MAAPDSKVVAVPKAPEEWVAKVDSLFDEHERTKYLYQRQWYLNIAHFLGFQYAQWNPSTQRIEEPKVPSYRVRLVANRIISSVQLALAKMTKTQPILNTLPATSEETDRNAARTGDKVLKCIWRKFEMGIRLLDVLLWMLLGGNAYWKIYWNPRTGPRVTYPLDMNEEPIIDEENSEQVPGIDLSDPANPKPLIKEFQLGDIAVDLVTPFEIIPDPSARMGKRGAWLMHVKATPLAEIRSAYPERGKDVHPEKDLTHASEFEQKLMSLISTFASSGQASNEGASDSAILKELWYHPCDDYPNGKLIAVANGVLLQDEEWPEENREPDASLDFGPFVKFSDIPVPGRYWAMSGVENLIPLQKNYNRSRSQVIEVRNLMSKPKYWIPRGANIHKSALTSEPGECVEYTPVGSHKPEPMTPPAIPSYVREEQDQTLRDMEESYGIHQVSKGEAPSGVRAGIAIRFLQEMDDTALGPKIRRMENSLGRAGTLILRCVKVHYKEKRTLQVVGANNEIEVVDFIGSDLGNCTDVVVQAGSGFPELKSAKQQYLLDLFTQGIFGPPEDPNVRGKVMRLLELGDVDSAYEDARLDEAWAEQENRLMAQGQAVGPQYFENHIIHKQILNRYMKTDAFRKLSKEKKELFVRHDVMHTKMLAPVPPPNPMDSQPSGPGAPEEGAPMETEPASVGGGDGSMAPEQNGGGPQFA